MSKMLVFVALGTCCLPARAGAAELYCGGADNPVCAVYRVCRQALDLYPESEVAGKGKECVLTIAGRRIIIRRKLVDGQSGYFFLLKRPIKKKAGPLSIRRPAASAKPPAARRTVRKAPAGTAGKKAAGRSGKKRNGKTGQKRKRAS